MDIRKSASVGSLGGLSWNYAYHPFSTRRVLECEAVVVRGSPSSVLVLVETVPQTQEQGQEPYHPYPQVEERLVWRIQEKGRRDKV